jgi:hypothetical protein
MKVFPHGQGNGDGATHYLVRPDYPGRDMHPPEVLRGDPELTRELIDTLDTKWKFTAGVLSWHPDEVVTPKQETRVMDDFEAVAFAGLEPDQRNILWVRHYHAGHHELHFVIPRVELSSGKAFNPCPPGWQKTFDVFRDLHNHREDWARPDDPARTRLRTPEHADLHRARLIRWGKTPGKDERAEAKDAVHAYLLMKIEEGQVTNRSELLSALREADLEINRAGKDYVTVKDPASGEKLRLKGGIYAEHWQLAGIPGRAHAGQDRTGPAGARNPDPTTTQCLKRELAAVIDRRATYNRGRYPGKAWDVGREHHLTLPNPELGLWQEMAARPAFEPGPSDGNHFGRLGRGDPAHTQGHGLTGRNSKPQCEQSRTGEHRRATRKADLGIEAPGEPGGTIYHPAAKDFGPHRLDGGETASREIGVDHDRDRTSPNRFPDGFGAGAATKPGNTERNPGQAAVRSDSSYENAKSAPAADHPTPSTAARINTRLTTLEHYTRKLRTLVDSIERYSRHQTKEVKHSPTIGVIL